MTAAASTIFDTPITTPGGCFTGSGCVNAGFTESSNNGFTIDIEALQRFVGPYIPIGNVYAVPTGTVAGNSIWGVTFSYSTPTPLAGYVFGFMITDLSQPASVTNPWTFSPTLIPDNSYWAGAGPKTTGTFAVNGGTSTIMQNSEAFSFAGIFPGFNPNANDSYKVVATITSVTGAPLDSDTIIINAGTAGTPEPVSIVLFSSGLIALGLVRRRLRKS